MRAPERRSHRSTGRPAPSGSASRAERRRAARVRRNRVVLIASTAASAGILGAWFPVSNLMHQRAELAAASSQLSRLDQQNASLRHQERAMRTPATLGRIAQQQYDLVPPGEQAYQVLPASGSAGSGPSGSDGTLGSVSGVGTGASRGAGAASRAAGRRASLAGSTGTSGSFAGRVLRTLEFWR